MNISPHLRLVGSGLLLTAFGFVLGLLASGPRHHAPPHRIAGPGYAYAQAYRPQPRALAYSMQSDGAATTVVVFQDGQPVQVAQSGPMMVNHAEMPAPPAPDNNHTGLWLALLLTSALAPLTWAALTWGRRKESSFTESEPYMETFVPRRDD